ncbi:hypothetical protein NQ318_005294, partial [Aromia moschata]
MKKYLYIMCIVYTHRIHWCLILQDKNTKDDKTKTTTKDEDNTVVNIVNKETQTDIIALNRCDSCSSAMLCMKNLLQSFEHEQFKGGRQVLRPKIYDITQFGCMLQTTTTIEDSLSTLFEKLFAKEQENEKNLKQHMVNTSIYKSKAVVNQDVNSFQVRGNPLEDLTRQIEENTEKINLLQTENAKLETVVKKL